MTRQMFKKAIALTALVGAFSMTATTKAEAAFYALICNDAACDGAGDVIVQDNAVGDNVANLGGISIVGANVGGLTVVVNTSQSKPLLGSATAPQLDLTYTVTGIGTVWLYATDTDFVGAQPLFGHVDGNTSPGTVGGVTAYIAGGNDNTSFSGPGATNLDLSSIVSGSDNTAPDTQIDLNKPAGGASPYFLTIGIRVQRSNGGTSTGDFNVVPEPASMSLFGLGLAGVAALRRRQARR